MALQSSKIDTVGNESLDEWRPVGSGGYGRVYKARHKGWGFDVAIKILHVDDRIFMTTEKVLWEEVKHMEKASCEFVVRVYGIYQGCPTVEETHMRQGIIMEFMGRGSVEFLLKELCGPPPWPLAFRLAHQVALGMNFLHSRNLMHHDLKPSNILLTDELHVKLADFGLSRVATSALSSIRETTQATGGSWKYMPPEAFEASYEPVRAFDRYSYGILLWSILTGKEPYPVADYNLVALRIPKGDRPPFDDINVKEAEGLKELVDLMKRCWEKTASNRPTFTKCLAVTENVFSKHKTGIRDAVHNVLKKLDLPAIHQDEKTSVEFNLPLQTPDEPALKGLENLKRFPEAQRSSEQYFPEEMSDMDKAKFVDDNQAVLIQNTSKVMQIAEELGNMVHRETYSVIKVKETNQEKMRELYLTAIHSGGVVVKAAFYDILKRQESQLMERLGMI